ncbi:hypothetical protein SBM3_00060 [Synechococcus phage S-BM3]|nr:hypothetical protein SBM3_00060 [Synechococcus phage S-BM3]
MRFKDTIKLCKETLKLAEKHPMRYTDAEILYMKKALRVAQEGLKRKRDLKSKGFKNEATAWISPTNISDSRSGEDDGVRSESEQSIESGEPEGSGTSEVLH